MAAVVRNALVKGVIDRWNEPINRGLRELQKGGIFPF
jgi:hypothetical protein